MAEGGMAELSGTGVGVSVVGVDAVGVTAVGVAGRSDAGVTCANAVPAIPAIPAMLPTPARLDNISNAIFAGFIFNLLHIISFR